MWETRDALRFLLTYANDTTKSLQRLRWLSYAHRIHKKTKDEPEALVALSVPLDLGNQSVQVVQLEEWSYILEPVNSSLVVSYPSRGRPWILANLADPRHQRIDWDISCRARWMFFLPSYPANPVVLALPLDLLKCAVPIGKQKSVYQCLFQAHTYRIGIDHPLNSM